MAAYRRSNEVVISSSDLITYYRSFFFLCSIWNYAIFIVHIMEKKRGEKQWSTWKSFSCPNSWSLSKVFSITLTIAINHPRASLSFRISRLSNLPYIISNPRKSRSSSRTSRSKNLEKWGCSPDAFDFSPRSTPRIWRFPNIRTLIPPHFSLISFNSLDFAVEVLSISPLKSVKDAGEAMVF